MAKRKKKGKPAAATPRKAKTSKTTAPEEVGRKPVRIPERAIFAAALCLFGAIALHYYRAIGSYVMDDAFIFLRYADNLINGHGLVYNPGEPVEGYTSFLWTVLLAGGLAAGLPVPSFAQVLAVLLAIATLFLVWRAGRLLFPSTRWAALIPVLFLASNRTFCVWAVQAMETKLFGATVAASFWVWLRYGFAGIERGRWRYLPLLGLVTALMPLSRPEGYLFAGLIMAAGFFSALKTRDFGSWARNLAGFTLLAGGHLLFRFATYGDLLPNTFYAKVPGLQIESGAIFLWRAARENYIPIYGILVLTGMLCFARAKELSGPRWFAILAVVLTALYLLLIGGDYFEFRFIDHILPFWAFLGVQGAFFVSQVVKNERKRFALVLSLATVWIGLNALTVIRPYEREEHMTNPEREAHFAELFARAGRWLGANLEPGESIAIRPAGIIAYLTRAYCLDLLGLNDREIARMERRRGNRKTLGHQKEATSDYARERGITYFIWHPRIRNRPCRPGACVCVEIAPSTYFWFHALTPDARLKHRLYRLNEHKGSLEGFTPRAERGAREGDGREGDGREGDVVE